MKLTKPDHDYCLRACADRRATDDERIFLSTMASTAAAQEQVTPDDYRRVQRLTGGFLGADCIFDRPSL